MSSAWKRSRLISRRTLFAGALAVEPSVLATRRTEAAAGPRQRTDLAEVQRLLGLVQRLDPSLDRGLRVRAVLGYLGDQGGNQAVSVTLFAEANPGATPERVVYEGAARFNEYGELDMYAGATTAAKERFERFRSTAESADISSERTRATLRDMAAHFIENGPSARTCRSLATTIDALGAAVRASGPSWGHASTFLRGPDEPMQRNDLAWRIEVVRRRPGRRQRFEIYVDPWGDVVWVIPRGEF